MIYISRLTWGGDDPFTHTLIVGPTRCGKTATVIKPIIYQILLAKARGVKCGLSVIEPKGDVAQFTVDLARELGIHAFHLDPTLPNSHQINLMKGPVDDVAEATIAVLQGMFGKQKAFFQLVQELTARNFIKLLKTNHGDKLDIMSVLRTLRDENTLGQNINILQKSGKDPELLSFFQNEMKGRSGEKWRELALGLRAQIENIVSNQLLRRTITGDSGIDLDRHMAEGGVLAVNTALGRLRRSGDAFGQFMAMHLQSATFRRPGTEKTRVPHYLIIDEKSRYINPDTEKFLSIAAEYRTAAIFATQSFSQLELESGSLSARAMKTAILSSCRNKICFGGVTHDDAKYFADELGKDWSITRQNTYDGNIVANLLPKTYRDTEAEEYRIRPTDIQDGLPRFHYIHKLTKDGTPQKPGIAIGSFVPRNWREVVRKELSKDIEVDDNKKPSKGLFIMPKIFNKGGDKDEVAKKAKETEPQNPGLPNNYDPELDDEINPKANALIHGKSEVPEKPKEEASQINQTNERSSDIATEAAAARSSEEYSNARLNTKTKEEQPAKHDTNDSLNPKKRNKAKTIQVKNKFSETKKEEKPKNKSKEDEEIKKSHREFEEICDKNKNFI